MLYRMTALQALADFGSTGTIGPLHCGASLNGIAEALGAPRDIGRVSKRRRWPHLFSYGSVELCVCHCRLVTSISVQTWQDSIDLPHSESKKIVSHPGHLTHRQVTSALEAIGCHWQPAARQQPPGQIALQAEPTGATLTFRTADIPEPLLENAGIWTSTHRCTPPDLNAPDDGFGAEQSGWKRDSGAELHGS